MSGMSKHRVSLLVVFVLAATAIVFAGTAGAQAEANFEVNITVDDTAQPGDNVEVTVEVTNTGDASGTQTVALTDNGEGELDQREVSLDSGESASFTLTWGNIPQEREIFPTVESDDDVEAETVEVRWTNVDVTDLSPGDVSLRVNETLSANATLTNTGTAQATQTIELVVGSETVAEKQRVFEGEEQQRISFRDVEVPLPPGTYTYRIAGPDDSATGTLTVREPPDPAEFTVDIDDWRFDDNEVTVDATLTNEGELGDTQPIGFELDGQRVQTQELTLNAGESESVTFTEQRSTRPANASVVTEAPDAESVQLDGANVEAGPRIDGVAPTDVRVGEPVSVTYTADGPFLESVRLLVETPNGNTVLNRGVEAGVERNFTFEPSAITDFVAGSYDVTIQVEDEFGRTERVKREGAFGPAVASVDRLQIENVQPDVVQTDESLQVTYSAVGENIQAVRLSAETPAGETVLQTALSEGRDQEQTYDSATFDDLPGGPYDLTLEIEDGFGEVESVTEEDAFRVGDTYDPSAASFTQQTYTGVAGDFTVVDVTLDTVDEAYILFGGYAPDGQSYNAPLDVLHVQGSTTFVVNTRLIGTDRPSGEVYIPISGSVTSYAHSIGPNAAPSGPFSDLRFENEAREQVATNLTEFRKQARPTAGGQLRPYQPGEYTLVVGQTGSLTLRDGRFPDPRFPFDRATLELTEPELGNATSYLVPEGNADQSGYSPEPEDIEEITLGDLDTIRSQAVETDTVSAGDRVLIEMEANGMWGAFVDAFGGASSLSGERTELITPQEFGEFISLPEGISLTAYHSNPEGNVARTELDLFDSQVSDVAFFTDPPPGEGLLEAPGQIYILIDTREPGPFDVPLEGGEQFQIEFAYQSAPGDRYTFDQVGVGIMPDPFVPEQAGRYPYPVANGTTRVQTATFSVVNRSVEYDRTDSQDRPVVVNESGQSITGTTTLPPVTDPVSIVIDVRQTPKRVELEDVEISDDGRFEVQHDFSDIDADSVVDIEFWYHERRVDRRQLSIFSSEDDFSLFEVRDVRTDAAVVNDEYLTDIRTTIQNSGTFEGSDTVELLVDGEVVEQQTVSLAANEKRTVHFGNGTEGLGIGSYPITVRTSDDSGGRLLVIRDPSPVFRVDGITAESQIDDNERSTTLSTTIRNAGSRTDIAEIELFIDNESAGQRPVALGENESQTLSFDPEVSRLEPGEYDIEIRTPNETASDRLVVRNFTSRLDVTNLTVESPIEQGGSLNSSFVVRNPGTVTANGTVELRLEDEEIERWNVSVASGTQRVLSVGNVTVDRSPGNYTVTVETDDFLTNAVLVVENTTESDEETDDSDSEDGDSETDGGGAGGFFGVGVGGRAALGGTVIVGAIHVLGYWV